MTPESKPKICDSIVRITYSEAIAAESVMFFVFILNCSFSFVLGEEGFELTEGYFTSYFKVCQSAPKKMQHIVPQNNNSKNAKTLSVIAFSADLIKKSPFDTKM